MLSWCGYYAAIDSARLRVPAVYDERRNRRACLSCSLTLEAALALPIFLFCMVLLLMPLFSLEAQRKMEAESDAICRNIALYAYGVEKAEKAADLDLDTGMAGVLLKAASGAALGAYASSEVREAADDSRIGLMSFLGSECMDDGSTVKIKLDYSYRLPFSVLGSNTIDRTVISFRRAWVGKKRSSGKEKESEEEEDPWVYIGKTSTRYHLSPGCHYLSNDLRAVTYDGVKSERNSGGSRYAPCARCGAGAIPGQTVYIMPSGEVFHTDPDCSAIVSYIRTVRLSEVEYMGVCSYCGKKK